MPPVTTITATGADFAALAPLRCGAHAYRRQHAGVPYSRYWTRFACVPTAGISAASRNASDRTVYRFSHA